MLVNNFYKNFYFLSLIIIFPSLAFSQAKKGGNNKSMTVAPEFEKGWYLPYKGDTIKGEIQTNAGETEAQFNISFFFKSPKSSKVTEINTKKAKAYGFGDRKFEILKIKEIEYYAEILEKGRVTIYQINEEKLEKGKKVAIPVYYITDAQADPKSKLAGLVELPKEKPYKKVLKELFKEQPMLIENVDKWYLQIDQVREAVREFNKIYKTSSPVDQMDSEEIEKEQVQVEKIN